MKITQCMFKTQENFLWIRFIEFYHFIIYSPWSSLLLNACSPAIPTNILAVARDHASVQTSKFVVGISRYGLLNEKYFAICSIQDMYLPWRLALKTRVKLYLVNSKMFLSIKLILFSSSSLELLQMYSCYQEKMRILSIHLTSVTMISIFFAKKNNKTSFSLFIISSYKNYRYWKEP